MVSRPSKSDSLEELPAASNRSRLHAHREILSPSGILATSYSTQFPEYHRFDSNSNLIEPPSSGMKEK